MRGENTGEDPTDKHQARQPVSLTRNPKQRETKEQINSAQIEAERGRELAGDSALNKHDENSGRSGACHRDVSPQQLVTRPPHAAFTALTSRQSKRVSPQQQSK